MDTTTHDWSLYPSLRMRARGNEVEDEFWQLDIHMLHNDVHSQAYPWNSWETWVTLRTYESPCWWWFTVRVCLLLPQQHLWHPIPHVCMSQWSSAIVIVVELQCVVINFCFKTYALYYVTNMNLRNLCAGYFLWGVLRERGKMTKTATGGKLSSCDQLTAWAYLSGS